jgi:DNA-binding transcriptional LysR family regulator
MERALVCVMPTDHPLAAKTVIDPKDLDQEPFVALNPDSLIRRRIDSVLDAYEVKPKIILVANLAATICEYVASGFGISLVHPLSVIGVEHRLAVRRFEPEIPLHFQLCRSAESKNARIVDAFMKELRTTAEQISSSALNAF